MDQRSLIWILWPSFLMAGVASAIIFAMIDPLDIVFFGYFRADRQAVYGIGFFLLWLMAALSSALSLYMSLGSKQAKELD